MALQLAVLAALIAAFFVRLPQVSGLSMEPHIRSGEYVVINTFAYRLGAPQRGDIVAFRHEGDDRAIFIKRVIGVPGDRIRIDRRQRLRQRRQARRAVRAATPTTGPSPRSSVPPGSVYVLGDNRAESEDSRFFGPVGDDRLVGRADRRDLAAAHARRVVTRP